MKVRTPILELSTALNPRSNGFKLPNEPDLIRAIAAVIYSMSVSTEAMKKKEKQVYPKFLLQVNSLLLL